MEAMKNDFSKGSIPGIIVRQSLPLILAQLVQLLYNIVDRIYIGHMGDRDSTALTGLGLTFPVITFIIAFAALFGMGGVPLFSIASGRGERDRAGRILGNSFLLVVASSVVIAVLGFSVMKPVLHLLGASSASYVYASEYLRIYLLGTTFSMIGTGLNGYISAQGYPRTGMLTVIIGAFINTVLDPVFIFAFHMGVSGAALATVISQIVSSFWILRFLTGRKASIRLEAKNIRFDPLITREITKLGASNFVMQGTTCFVQAICNSTLQTYGGDIYVGIMTVLNSIRDVFMLPVSGLMSGSQPVMGFNYGAGRPDRVRQAVRFNTLLGFAFTTVMWLLIIVFPGFWFRIFSDDPSIIAPGIESLHIYFFGFVFMSFQFAGQSTFQALGDAGHAVFFSLLRKAFIVIPLTIILPRLGAGVSGVFIAEPVSNAVGGLSCFITMYFTVYRKLLEKPVK